MIKNVKIANLLYILAFTLACIRGLIEFYLGKQLAFIIQSGGIIFCLALLVNYKYIFKLIGSTIYGLYIFLIVILGFISIMATVFINGNFGPNYIVLILFTIFLILFTKSAIHKNLIASKYVYRAALIVCFILSLVAIAQQLRMDFIEFPGHTADFGLIRPQSITGSFLHYPLIIAIITCVSLVRSIKKPGFFSVGIFVYFFIVLILTLSRSGMFIVFFVLIYYTIKKFNKSTLLFLVASVLVIFAFNIIFPVESAIIGNRIFGSTSINSEGNDSRYEVWQIGIKMLSVANLFFGTFFGLVTNSAPEQYSKGVVESGFLQQFLNIGLIATISYYGLLWRTNKLLAPEYKIILVACLLQSCIYQSIEVIPFLFLLLTLPIYTLKT